jgi:hypothetical protein
MKMMNCGLDHHMNCHHSHVGGYDEKNDTFERENKIKIARVKCLKPTIASLDRGIKSL